MTDQKKVSIPDDIKVSLQSLAKGSKIDVKVLVQEMGQIMQTDETIKAMPEEAGEQKIRFAWALLCRKHTATGRTQMYFKLVTKPMVRQIKSGKYVGDVVALVKEITMDEEKNPVVGETKLGAGTLWEKAAENLKGLDPKKVYKADLFADDTKATIGGTTFQGLELSGNDASFLETTEVTMPTNEEFYKEFIEPKEKDLRVSLGEVDLNRAANVMDIRIATGMVIDVGEKEKPTTGEYGYYVLTDDSLLGGGEKGGSGSFFIRVHPEEAIWERSSNLKFVGAIYYDKKNDVDRWTSYFVIPTKVAMKRVIQPKPVGKQSVDVDLGQEMDEEHKKIEESIGGDDFIL